MFSFEASDRNTAVFHTPNVDELTDKTRICSLFKPPILLSPEGQIEF